MVSRVKQQHLPSENTLSLQANFHWNPEHSAILYKEIKMTCKILCIFPLVYIFSCIVSYNVYVYHLYLVRKLKVKYGV